MKLFAVISFSRSRSGAPLDRHLCSAEDANSPRAFSVPLSSLHQTVSTSDALLVTRRHARVGLLNRPMR
jgi:hypothetical protein